MAPTREIFRDETRIIELAGTLTERTRNLHLVLWVAMIVILAGGKCGEQATLLLKHLV